MIRRDFIKASVLAGLYSQLSACSSSSKQVFSSLERQFDTNRKIAADRVQLPQGPSLHVSSFGAVGDGKTLNTDILQRALNSAATQGAKLVIDGGQFVTGTLIIPTNTHLHIEEGAALLGSNNIADYQRSARGWYTLLSAHKASNISISGGGKIDGRGRQTALNIDYMHHSGERPVDNYNSRRMRPHESDRPQIIDFIDCHQISIFDVTITNSASWVQTYYHCTDVHIDNIKVVSDAYWNNDGIDFDGVVNGRISNCFINAADDAICIKSEQDTQINDSIIIEDCIVRSSSNGVKFGTSSYKGFKNITIRNIHAFDTYRSAVCLGCVDGGYIDNIKIKNITATNTGNGFVIRLGQRYQSAPPGSIRNVTIDGLTAQIAFMRADSSYQLRGPGLNAFFNPIPASITGLPDAKVTGITLKNISLTYPGVANKGLAYIPVSQLFQVPEKRREYPEYSMFGELPSWALYVRHATGINLKNLKLNELDSDFRPALVLDDVAKLVINDIDIGTSKVHQQLILNDVSGASVYNVSLQGKLLASGLKLGQTTSVDSDVPGLMDI